MLSFSPSLAITAFTAALCSLLLATPAVASLFVEDFNGKTNATVGLTLESSNPANIVHTVANDFYNLRITDSATASAQVLDATGGDFQVQADFSPNEINFTSGQFGIFARSSSGPSQDAGIYLRIRNDGFNNTSFVLELINASSNVASSSVFDLTSFSDAASVSLTLTGIEQANGDYQVTGELIPDPSDNAVGLTAQSVNATILSSALPSGDGYGIRARIFSTNPLDIDVDNFSSFTGVIPEPASILGFAVPCLILLGRRCRRGSLPVAFSSRY